MDLSNLQAPEGGRRKRKRVGRGQGSGNGKTAGRGMKGTGARSGKSRRWGFEGGQMPLQRRIPKRGFTNIFRRELAVVNVRDLSGFDAGATVDHESLAARGLVPRSAHGVKLLGEGEIDKALTIQLTRCSESAKSKIEAAGGSVATDG